MRLRQAVLAARELDEVVARLRDHLGLGEPFADPLVAHFGLRNAVFALGDTFLEVVSPLQEGTTAGRLLDKRGGDCGYMAMFQVDDLDAARARARAAGVREVWSVALDDIAEAHLHPSDMGAIVAITRPDPPASWRWGGPDWEQRSAPRTLAGITLSMPDATRERWTHVLGGAPPGVDFVPGEDGLVEIRLAPEGDPLRIGRVLVI